VIGIGDTGCQTSHRVVALSSPSPLPLEPVMWSETDGLRTRPVWDQKKSVLVLVLQAVVLVLVLHTAVLVLQVWCCFVKYDLVTLVVIMILKDTATI